MPDMSSVSLILLLLNAMSMKEIGLVVADDECSSKADCRTDLAVDLVCCKGHSRDSERTCTPYNCHDRFCFTDGDCARSECCLDNVCVDSYRCRRCDSNSHCARSEYCCKRGLYPNVCRRSCVAEECDENTDCAAPDECCDSDNKCIQCKNSDSSSFSDGKIAVIVLV